MDSWQRRGPRGRTGDARRRGRDLQPPGLARSCRPGIGCWRRIIHVGRDGALVGPRRPRHDRRPAARSPRPRSRSGRATARARGPDDDSGSEPPGDLAGRRTTTGAV
jgi:hypothetical protein